jgi:hypothetical protein
MDGWMDGRKKEVNMKPLKFLGGLEQWIDWASWIL